MSLNKDFHALTIAQVRRETPDSISVRFEVPEEMRETFRYRAGQHLTLRADIAGKDMRRTYSLCTSPGQGEWRIAIKRMPHGVFSNWANDGLAAGQSLDVLPPMGRFVLPEIAEKAPHYVGIAGGSGITPVIAILKHVLETDGEGRFTLVYGNRNTPSILFLEELAGLKDRYLDRLAIYHVLEDEAGDIELFNGRLDREKCDAILDRLIAPEDVTAFFVCGPGPMMDAVEASLDAHGVARDRILIERFSTSPPPEGAAETPKPAGAPVTKLTVELDGRRTRVGFDSAQGTILESVQAAGLHAPYACRGGVCTTCRAKVLAGEVTMRKNYGLTEEEVAQGYVLTCQAVPQSEAVELSYDL
jgi:ring-1,2-phenylacetyl-CoA epoxidase subunit PaaE